MSERILIVEDERITAEDLRDILTGLGYVVTAVVSTGADAIREAEHNPPDLVLMDIRIKGAMDGTETARILNERFGIPAIYLTAHADRDTLIRAKRAKPLGYMVKPFQETEMHAAVEIALHRHREDRKAGLRREELSEVLRNALLGIVSVDGSEIVMIMNPAAERLTGWPNEDAVGGPVRRVFRLADLSTGQQAELPLGEVLEKGVLAEIKDRLLITRNGEMRPISGSVSPVPAPDGAINGAVIVFEPADASPEDPFLKATLKEAGGTTTLRFGKFHLLAVSEPMKQVLAYSLRVARSEANSILLEGESGTGKDLIAQFIHYSSSRMAGPFVPVNCAAIPETLIETELFGHEKGSFTDARADKKGLFELANGGTLFLDEIGELSPAVQAKLLRVLEDQTFRRIGGLSQVEVDVRVIAATNIRLADAVQQGKFRVDLFHRLTVIPITIPPLRDRPADIMPLATHFAREYSRKHKSRVTGISKEASDALLAHEWPGNVRELRNVIERAVLMEEGAQIQLADIQFVALHAAPPDLSPALQQPASSGMSLKDSERNLVLKALQKAGGNQTKAARLLGITRDMLRHRVKKMGLKIDDQ